jgi:ABC-type antimicrobial peptide transport system permease subunit
MSTICGLLALVLTAFILYIDTSRSRRELAVLKALGYANRHIYVSVTVHAALLVGVALLAAVLLVEALAAVTPAFLPELSLEVTAATIVKSGLTALVVALAATLVAARQVASVDPLSVFHSS